MAMRALADRLRVIGRGGLRPGSPAAFSAAVILVVLATLLRLAIDFFVPTADPFATYLPAVLLATLVGGVSAGIVAMLLGAVISYWIFMPPNFYLAPLTFEAVVDFALYAYEF
jgi:K+-sensing histidine kinase KdpD